MKKTKRKEQIEEKAVELRAIQKVLPPIFNDILKVVKYVENDIPNEPISFDRMFYSSVKMDFDMAVRSMETALKKIDLVLKKLEKEGT